jgi:hypothetical protein
MTDTEKYRFSLSQHVSNSHLLTNIDILSEQKVARSLLFETQINMIVFTYHNVGHFDEELYLSI